ncbi:penicillin-binding protein 1A [Halieaceae bacterium IMCC14734]|uniref:Penicillin-binding protein 1A n=2 Tax=Candidatus Litorirhabdus singularis TaxID=2518993 RepID=A0ABT3TBX2_9GAMM|nr:penicillin-binding protein 1A [Candidatus Litorirhabdus singularis]
MKTVRILFHLVLLGLCAGIVTCGGIYLYLSPQLPAVEQLREIKLQTPMRVYTREGDLIGQFGEQKRNPLPYDRIPPQFVQALLAAEDDGFFRHVGIDFAGLLRAASELVLTGEKGSGGSTLTMQVARNYFLTLERTFTRKFKEILLSLEIERSLSKEEIFELYFNRIFLGHRSYGFEAAAQVYYGSHIGELDLAQYAMLAGLPKAPSSYNPISNPQRAKVRRDWILGRMAALGYITPEEYQQALQQPVSATHHGAKLAFNAPYAAEMARKEMLDRFGLAAYNDGFHVYTTISSELQLTANTAIVNGLVTYDQRHGYRGPEQQLPPRPDTNMLQLWQTRLQETAVIAGFVPAIVTNLEEQSIGILLTDGTETLLPWEHGPAEARPYRSENARGSAPTIAADIWAVGDLIRVEIREQGLFLAQIPEAQAALVALRPDDGAVLSVVGGLGFGKSKFNRATQATRQPGSNFKPFIYAAALENGFTAASIINDAPVVFEDAVLEDTWRPENDGGRFYGPTRLRWALTKSRNLVSIRLLQQLGIRKAINYSSRFGFDPDALAADLSLALGTQAITPMQLVAAYAAIANGGYRVEPYLIERIEDYRRDEIFRATPLTVCRDCEQTGDENAVTAEEGLEEVSMEDILAAEARQLPAAPRIMDARVAFILDSILKDVVTKGTARRARVLERTDIGGKTGTTNGPVDAWFSGYNPDVVATTWLGFDQNLLLGKREFGGSAALPIWIDYMRVALRDSRDLPREIPPGIVNVRIDPETGLLAKPGQAKAMFEFFRVEQVPTRSAPNQANEAGYKIQSENLQEQLF